MRTDVIVALSCLLFAAGCRVDARTGGASRERVYPVSGSVTFKGKPAVNARVLLTALNRPAEAPLECDLVTSEEGTFICGTYDFEDGLPIGKYEVRITWPVSFNGGNREGEVDRLKGRYFNQPQMIEVKPENNLLLPFDLK